MLDTSQQQQHRPVMLLVNLAPVIKHHDPGVLSHRCSDILPVKMARTPPPSSTSVRPCCCRLFAHDGRRTSASAPRFRLQHFCTLRGE
ncbi:hypothetical protein PAMP_006008 [Pampus punctatissimus]